MSDLWFLKSVENQEVQGVAEGGDFVPGGMIGLVQKFRARRLWSDVDPEDMETKPDTSTFMKSGWELIYTDFDEALKAQAELGSEIRPASVFYFEMPTSTIINRPDEVLAKFGNSVGGCVDDVTLASVVHRSTTHLVYLPRLVWAMATAAGISVPDFDLSDIDMSGRDFNGIATLAYQERLVGSGEAGYEDSQYWQARAKLWAALGEPDPTKCVPTGTMVSMRNKVVESKWATSSPVLSSLLELHVKNWDPMLARLKLMPDPVHDSVSKAGNRVTFPVVWELFKDKAAAEAARDEDSAASGDTSVTTTDGFYVPEELATMEEEWKAHIEEAIDEKRNLKVVADEFDVTVQDVKDAIESLKSLGDIPVVGEVGDIPF